MTSKIARIGDGASNYSKDLIYISITNLRVTLNHVSRSLVIWCITKLLTFFAYNRFLYTLFYHKSDIDVSFRRTDHAKYTLFFTGILMLKP